MSAYESNQSYSCAGCPGLLGSVGVCQHCPPSDILYRHCIQCLATPPQAPLLTFPTNSLLTSPVIGFNNWSADHFSASNVLSPDFTGSSVSDFPMSPNSLNELGIPASHTSYVNGRRHPIQEFQSMQERETITFSQSLVLGLEFQRARLIDIFPNIDDDGVHSQQKLAAVQLYPTPDDPKQVGLASPPVQNIQLAHEPTDQAAGANPACQICGATSLTRCNQSVHEMCMLFVSIASDQKSSLASIDSGIMLDSSQVFGASSTLLPECAITPIQPPNVILKHTQSVAPISSNAQSSSVVADQYKPSNRCRALTGTASTSQRRRLPVRFAHSNQLSFPPPVQDALLQILHSIRNHPYPNAQLIDQIQRRFGLTKKQIQNWFALRRYRYMKRSPNEGADQWHFRNESL